MQEIILKNDGQWRLINDATIDYEDIHNNPKFGQKGNSDTILVEKFERNFNVWADMSNGCKANLMLRFFDENLVCTSVATGISAGKCLSESKLTQTYYVFTVHFRQKTPACLVCIIELVSNSWWLSRSCRRSCHSSIGDTRQIQKSNSKSTTISVPEHSHRFPKLILYVTEC